MAALAKTEADSEAALEAKEVEHAEAMARVYNELVNESPPASPLKETKETKEAKGGLSSPSRRARWVVFEGSGGSSAAASVLSALVALQAVCRARYVRSVRIPALKEQAYNDLLQKILGRVAPLLQAMARGRFNNNKH